MKPYPELLMAVSEPSWHEIGFLCQKSVLNFFWGVVSCKIIGSQLCDFTEKREGFVQHVSFYSEKLWFCQPKDRSIQRRNAMSSLKFLAKGPHNEKIAYNPMFSKLLVLIYYLTWGGTGFESVRLQTKNVLSSHRQESCKASKSSFCRMASSGLGPQVCRQIPRWCQPSLTLETLSSLGHL